MTTAHALLVDEDEPLAATRGNGGDAPCAFAGSRGDQRPSRGLDLLRFVRSGFRPVAVPSILMIHTTVALRREGLFRPEALADRALR